jgi:acetyltransferase-like isoleucine patch superfamily enzyme
MNLATTIKENQNLKKLAIKLLTPKGQARPRLWVRWLINPFVIKKGRGSSIQRRTRIDILPSKAFRLGRHSTIEDFCTVNNGVGAIRIGDNTRIGIGSVLIGPVSIGNDVRIAQHVVISGLNHNYADVSRPISQQGVTTDQIYIGDETWIGANAVILPGVFIGQHCVVAAGSVVNRNVPSYSLVAGNPARIVRQYNGETNAWDKV